MKGALDGKVLPQSDADALAAFRRAADRGSAAAAYAVGDIHCAGRGFPVVPRVAGRVGYHARWHVGLHYLVRSRQLGLKEHEGLANVARVLKGLRAALAEDYLTFADSQTAGPPGPGAVRDLQLAFVRFCPAAEAVAADWRREFPDTFKVFCEEFRVDPGTIRPVPR